MNSGQERVAVLVTLQLAWLIETLIGERVDRKTLFSSLCFHMTQAGTRGLEPGDWVEVVAPGDDLDGKPGRIEAIVDHGDGFDVIVMGSPNTWRFRRDKLRKIPPPLPPSEQQLELSYDAGEKTMSAQDTHLGDVRSRANILLSTSALFISFSAGIGLIKTDPTKGAVLSPTKGIVLLFVVLVLGLCVLYVLWPVKEWIYSADAEKLMKRSNSDTRKELQAFVVEEMIKGINRNDNALNAKQRAFRFAAALLIVEIVLLVVFLTLWK